MFPDLIRSFRRVTKPISTTIYATAALLAGTVSLAAQETPEWSHVKAESDPAIIAACPTMSETALTTMPAQQNNIYGIRSHREFSIGFITPDVMATEDELAERQWLLHSMQTANRHNMIVLNINSKGGSTNASEAIVNAARNSGALIVTRSQFAASGATPILFAGTPGYRNILNITPLIIHAGRNVTQEDAALAIENGDGANPVHIKFEEDYSFEEKSIPALESAQSLWEDGGLRQALLIPAGMTDMDAYRYGSYARLRDANDRIQQEYVSLSHGQIDLDCAQSVVRGKDDVLVHPETALRFQWVDTVYNIDTETKALDGTMTVRHTDPRAVAYRQQIASRQPNQALTFASGAPPAP